MLIQDRRKQLKEVIGTPLYPLVNPAIPAGGEWIVHLETHSEFNKYLPYDVVEITNLSGQHGIFFWNQIPTLGYRSFNNSSRKIERVGFRTFRLLNIGTAAMPAETIELIFYTTGLTADKKAKEEESIPLIRLLQGFSIHKGGLM